MYSKTFILLALVASTFAATQNYVRFVNAIQGQNLTVQTNELGNIPLNYQDITQYFLIPAGGSTVTVTKVVNTAGISFNGQNILITADGYTTMAVAYDSNGNFNLLKFNETIPAYTSGNALIRVISLGGAVGYISVANGNNVLFTYVGANTGTAYAEIPTSTTSLNIYQAGGVIANTYPIDLSSGFAPNTAYTIFFFTPASGPLPKLATDRAVGNTTGVATTGVAAALTSGVVTAMTSGSASSITSGSASSVTSGTPFVPATSGSVPVTSGTVVSVTSGSPVLLPNPSESASYKLEATIAVVFLALAAL